MTNVLMTILKVQDNIFDNNTILYKILSAIIALYKGEYKEMTVVSIRGNFSRVNKDLLSHKTYLNTFNG